MWSKLTKYLVGGAASGAEEDGQDQEILAIPIEARLRQVEVEGDDWILIDRNVEGSAGLDESWYVTPPACFTQPGPVHVETSPLEDLLIEHPSMSVYRSASRSGSTAVGEAAAKPGDGCSKKQQRSGKRRPAVPEPTKPAANRLPLATRNADLTVQATTATSSRNPKPAAGQAGPNSTSSNNNNRPSHHHHNHHHHHHHHGAVAEQAPRRATMRDLRNARGDENVRIVQIRSAQKMLEKRTSQSTKRNRLERGNKTREVASGKGRRPRRQDRLRLNNSGANNNRKC